MSSDRPSSAFDDAAVIVACVVLVLAVAGGFTAFHVYRTNQIRMEVMRAEQAARAEAQAAMEQARLAAEAQAAQLAAEKVPGEGPSDGEAGETESGEGTRGETESAEAEPNDTQPAEFQSIETGPEENG